MNRELLRALGVAALCFTASGCVSLFANGILFERSDPPGLYAGVRGSVHELANPSVPASPITIAAGALMVLDLPLEAAMDTLLIPYIAVCTIEWYSRTTPFRELNSQLRQEESERRPEPRTPKNENPSDDTDKLGERELQDPGPKDHSAPANQNAEASDELPTVP